MEPLQTWWATELYPSKDDEKFGVAGDFEVVKAADAQATIAVLQARAQELEAIKIPDDAFTYCAYCGEKSPVDEHNEDLAAHIKVCPKHPMRDVESQLTQRTAECDALKLVNDTHMKTVMKLSHVVEQRTAERDCARRRVDELEAREVDVVLLREDLEKRTAELEAANKLLYRKNCELGRFETIISDLQAELERVRGELATHKETKHDAI